MRLINTWRQSPTFRTLTGLLALAGWYATRVEPRWLRVTRLTLPLHDLPPAFDGYRIAHISDHHLGMRTADALLPRVVALVNREGPDLVAMTGDLVTWGRAHNVSNRTVAPLGDLRAPDGVWSVLGNHDYVDPRFVGELLCGAGITLLRNEARIIRRSTDGLAVVGLDDVHFGTPDLNAALAHIPADMPALLLVHEPDFATAAAAYPNILLQLSGHTHGGQVTMLQRPLLLPQHGRTFYRGLRSVRRMWVYVTTGTGTGRFVIRFGSRPEIALITLRRAAGTQPVV